jgi:ribA/ribD-fused uncharacterized protein
MAETHARNRRRRNPTYRILDDGEQIEGTWRPVFIKNGPSYHLADLKIYADGLIDCWGLVDLAGFREKIRTGWIATSIDESGQASAHHLASWQFHEPKSISPQQLLDEVEDTIAELQGQPTASERCIDALSLYVSDRSDANLVALREAYLAIPEHLRVYVLGDMDRKDWPLRALIAEPGEAMQSSRRSDQRAVTPEDKAAALRYFESTDFERKRWRETTHDGDPDGLPPAKRHPSIDCGFRFYGTGGWNMPDGDGFLSNSIPLPIDVDGVEYRSVTHAYWALSTDHPGAREAIRLAETPSDARRLALDAERREDWANVRLAVMIDLLRRKFDQYPKLGDQLLATGDARIRCRGALGTYWDTGADSRNWLGRALEVVRSELALDRARAED